MATASSRHDLSAVRGRVMRFSPRQCDLMIVAAGGDENAAGAAADLAADARAEVVHLDGCLCLHGGVFDTYAVVQGVDRFIPVDIYVPGCPPRPEQLIAGIMALQQKVKNTGTAFGTEFAGRTQAMGPTPFDPDELIRIREANEQLQVVSLN